MSFPFSHCLCILSLSQLFLCPFPFLTVSASFPSPCCSCVLSLFSLSLHPFPLPTVIESFPSSAITAYFPFPPLSLYPILAFSVSFHIHSIPVSFPFYRCPRILSLFLFPTVLVPLPYPCFAVSFPFLRCLSFLSRLPLSLNPFPFPDFTIYPLIFPAVFVSHPFLVHAGSMNHIMFHAGNQEFLDCVFYQKKVEKIVTLSL